MITLFKLQITVIILEILSDGKLKQWSLAIPFEKRKLLSLDDYNHSINLKTNENHFAGYIFFYKNRTLRVLDKYMPTVSIDVKNYKFLMINGVEFENYKIPFGFLNNKENQDLYELTLDYKMAEIFEFSTLDRVLFQLSPGKTVYKGYHGYTKRELGDLIPTFISVDGETPTREIHVTYIEIYNKKKNTGSFVRNHHKREIGNVAVHSHWEPVKQLRLLYRDIQSKQFNDMVIENFVIGDINSHKLKQWGVPITIPDREKLSLDLEDYALSFKTYEDRFAGYILFNRDDRTPLVLNIEEPNVLIDVKNKKFMLLNRGVFEEIYEIAADRIKNKEELYTLDVFLWYLKGGRYNIYRNQIEFRLSPGETVFKGYFGFSKDRQKDLSPILISVDSEAQAPEINVIYIEVEKVEILPISKIELKYRDIQSKVFHSMTTSYYIIKDALELETPIPPAPEPDLSFASILQSYKRKYINAPNWSITIMEHCRKELGINGQDLVFKSYNLDSNYFSGFLFFNKNNNFILRSELFPTIFIYVGKRRVEMVLSVERDKYKNLYYIMPEECFKQITNQGVQKDIQMYQLTFNDKMADYLGFRVKETANIEIKKGEDFYSAYHGYRKDSTGKLVPMFIKSYDRESELKIKDNFDGTTQLIYKNKSFNNDSKVVAWKRNLKKERKSKKEKKKGKKKRKIELEKGTRAAGYKTIDKPSVKSKKGKKKKI